MPGGGSQSGVWPLTCCQQRSFPRVTNRTKQHAAWAPWVYPWSCYAPLVLLWRSVTWHWMKMLRLYRSLCLRCIYFSFSHTADLILHCDPSACPVTPGLAVMLSYNTRAAAYKLVPLGVMLVLWSQWPLANTWLNMWGLRMSVSLLKAASVCLSAPYGRPCSC